MAEAILHLSRAQAGITLSCIPSFPGYTFPEQLAGDIGTAMVLIIPSVSQLSLEGAKLLWGQKSLDDLDIELL